jgi:hypothetical protein
VSHDVELVEHELRVAIGTQSRTVRRYGSHMSMAIHCGGAALQSVVAVSFPVHHLSGEARSSRSTIISRTEAGDSTSASAA